MDTVLSDEAGMPPDDPEDDPRPGTAAWWLSRETRPRPKRHRSLTLEGILDAAMALLDARGAAALTMRNLATPWDASSPRSTVTSATVRNS